MKWTESLSVSSCSDFKNYFHHRRDYEAEHTFRDLPKITRTLVAYHQRIHCKHPDDAEIADTVVPTALRTCRKESKLWSRSVVVRTCFEGRKQSWEKSNSLNHNRYENLKASFRSASDQDDWQKIENVALDIFSRGVISTIRSPRSKTRLKRNILQCSGSTSNDSIFTSCPFTLWWTHKCWY